MAEYEQSLQKNLCYFMLVTKNMKTQKKKSVHLIPFFVRHVPQILKFFCNDC